MTNINFKIGTKDSEVDLFNSPVQFQVLAAPKMVDGRFTSTIEFHLKEQKGGATLFLSPKTGPDHYFRTGSKLIIEFL